jgi:hypothetical protein
LRRETDGEYYLLTPVEKWRIKVQDHALRIIDIVPRTVAGVQVLEAQLNTGAVVTVDEQHSLFIDVGAGGIAALTLDHGLSALCTRSAWYRLVELADVQGKDAVWTSGAFTLRMPIEKITPDSE